MIQNGRRRLDSCTLTSIVAENGDYNRRSRQQIVAISATIESPILATISANPVTSICYGFVVPTSRTDASHKSRRRRRRRT